MPEDESSFLGQEPQPADGEGAKEGRSRIGVQQLTVEPVEEGLRLDRFLARRLGDVPHTGLFRIIRRGEVRVNGKRASPDSRLGTGDRIRVPPVWRPQEGGEKAKRMPAPSMLETVARAVVQEDERLLVLDKPAGIAVHGGSGISFGVIEALRALKPDESLELVHRLDRDTSGCLLVARDAATLRTLHALLREGRFEKRYLALLAGQWDLGRKRIDVPLRTDARVSGERTVRVDAGGKPSVSEFRPVQFFGKLATLVEVALYTGRTHQIRVHARYAGHPVAGDEKYGDPEFNERMRSLGLERMFLHAHSIGFEWPRGGPFSASAPLPPDLAALLDRLQSAPKRPARSRRR